MLADLQKDFFNEVFGKSSRILSQVNQEGRLSPAQRIKIYQNNAFFILTEHLKAAFPATATLASEAFFNYLCREFIKSSPPTNGDMNLYGAQLPDFMKSSGLVDQYPFLVDLARLEWYRQESYMADEDRSASAVHPTLRTISSVWPVLSLWKAGKQLIAPESIDMDSGEYVLVFRQENGIEMWRVDHDTFSLVSAVLEKRDYDSPAGFDMRASIQNLVVAGIITAKGEQ